MVATEAEEEIVQMEPVKDEKIYELVMDFDLPKKKKKRRTVSMVEMGGGGLTPVGEG